MAKTYRRNLGTRLINSPFRLLTQLGLGASYRHILTVPGRKTGRRYSTPVDLIEVGGERWLVAGYGPASWVKNVRAAGDVTLSRGRNSQRFAVEEAEAQAAVQVLRNYIAEIRPTRPYFDATPDSPDQDVADELHRHAAFRLVGGGDVALAAPWLDNGRVVLLVERQVVDPLIGAAGRCCN
jgi:deazaflavin-dependent oxidoreductase (nitroreductase family)